MWNRRGSSRRSRMFRQLYKKKYLEVNSLTLWQTTRFCNCWLWTLLILCRCCSFHFTQLFCLPPFQKAEGPGCLSGRCGRSLWASLEGQLCLNTHEMKWAPFSGSIYISVSGISACGHIESWDQNLHILHSSQGNLTIEVWLHKERDREGRKNEKATSVAT